MYGTYEHFDTGLEYGHNLADALHRPYLADSIASVEWAMEETLDLADDAPMQSEEAYYRGMASALHQRYQRLIRLEASLYHYDVAPAR
jgi:hypothetical protein